MSVMVMTLVVCLTVQHGELREVWRLQNPYTLETCLTMNRMFAQSGKHAIITVTCLDHPFVRKIIRGQSMTDLQRLDDIAGETRGTLAAFQNAFYKEYRGLNDRLINAALVAALNAVAPLIRAPLESALRDSEAQAAVNRTEWLYWVEKAGEFDTQLSLAQSALRTARADAMEWRPIGTAPRNKTTVVLAYFSEDGKFSSIQVGWWCVNFWARWESDSGWCPSHWRPLPDPPRSLAQTGGEG